MPYACAVDKAAAWGVFVMWNVSNVLSMVDIVANKQRELANIIAVCVCMHTHSMYMPIFICTYTIVMYVLFVTIHSRHFHCTTYTC